MHIPTYSLSRLLQDLTCNVSPSPDKKSQRHRPFTVPPNSTDHHLTGQDKARQGKIEKEDRQNLQPDDFFPYAGKGKCKKKQQHHHHHRHPLIEVAMQILQLSRSYFLYLMFHIVMRGHSLLARRRKKQYVIKKQPR